MPPDPHENLGRYELLTQLGRGGMAETWRARLVGAAGITKPVLIKKVLPQHAHDEDFIEMFISEARISATLSHGNIAQVFDFGRMEGQYFLAMELVDGQPLHRILKRAARTGLKQMPIPLAVYIALEMCRGLHYAHSRTDEKGEPLHIVHRDISPDNVLISYEGQVKIVDFGIAKARMLRNFDTEPGVVRGKFLYFSPEQARGRAVDARTDVWATGLVLYEMLCGQLPVIGTQAAVMSRMAHGEFPSPREVRAELPSALNELVMRALSVDASLRYESANAFGDALAAFLYPFAPRFSPMNLAYLVRELFNPDLLQEGRELTVPPTFVEELSAWRGVEPAAPVPPPERRRTPGPAPASSKVSLPKRDALLAPTMRMPAVASPRKSPAWARLALILGGGLLVLVGVLHDGPSTEEAALQPPPDDGASRLARYPEPGVVAPPGDSTLKGAAPEVAVAGERSAPGAGPEGASEAEPIPAYPAMTTFRLDSRLHVLRVHADLVAFSPLDPLATYRLWGTNPMEGVPQSSAILEPSPSRELPVFFLSSGDSVPPESRMGTVSPRPVSIRGPRSIMLFTLGEPTKDDLASHTVYLRELKSNTDRRFTFHPEPMRISGRTGLLIRGLDPRQTYGLSFNPVGKGVFLRGPGEGPTSQVACLEWDPRSTTKGPVSRAATAGNPLQFLLTQGRDVKVRGIQGLRCGFIDDAAFDNEGEAEVSITAWEPRRARSQGGQGNFRVQEATRLATQAQRLARSGQHHDAFLLAEDCLSNVPEQPDCLLLSGAMQQRLGRMDGALDRYRTFVQRYPSHPQAATVTTFLKSRQ
ncbi:serine/threonine protein kinase [Myxococcus eversor]|uniref:serine/threonine protein kinase n=1 Tax=Myxococcus eversor TaxID=2709661 RepID=UPI00308412EA